MNHLNIKVANQLNLSPANVGAALDLFASGNTIPFVARYRKEATGGLDETELRLIRDSAKKLEQLIERRKTILAAINEQGALTAKLKNALLSAETLTQLDDLYLPFKKKRRTRADAAREIGLEPLAKLMLAHSKSNKTAVEIARPFCSKACPTPQDALAGARDIIAEQMSLNPRIRATIRTKALKYGRLISERINDAPDPKGVFQLYYQFSQRVDRLHPYQILALNRGEKEKVLRLKLELQERDWWDPIINTPPFSLQHHNPFTNEIETAALDSGKRLLLPAIERDIRRTLTERANEEAIAVFAKNLRALLNQPPLANRTILGIDPAFRTGCKIAVIDPTGKLLETTTIYPHAPQNKWDAAKTTLEQLIRRHDISLITVGNGTASRETEQLAAEICRNHGSIQYLIVNEAGASVYSASPLAVAELPELNVSIRGAVSIARRAQDPLAELVKIDPQSIGVGMYQHDLNQNRLADALSDTVESVVNQVGVDLNTASPALLAHISGIGPKLADNIVAYREENGRFPDRQALAAVPGVGAKTFLQAAGFLRIPSGHNPLDATGIHPESYPAAHQLLRLANLTMRSKPNQWRNLSAKLLSNSTVPKLAKQLKIGIPTLQDILKQFSSPGRDPRLDLPPPLLRTDILTMEHLQPGQQLQGTVRNVVAFGAFVDIGVKQDGLLHRSKIPRGMNLKPGDILDLIIFAIEPERNRIQLCLTE